MRICLTRAAVVAVAGIGIASAAGCHVTTSHETIVTVGQSEVVNDITSFVQDKMGHKPESVTCPGDLKGPVGTTMNCHVGDAGQSYPIVVKVTGTQGDKGTIEIDAYRMQKDQVVAKVTAWATPRLGHPPGSVTCPGDLFGFVGASEVCQVVDAGKSHPVTVKVTAVNGTNVTTAIEG